MLLLGRLIVIVHVWHWLDLIKFQHRAVGAFEDLKVKNNKLTRFASVSTKIHDSLVMALRGLLMKKCGEE